MVKYAKIKDKNGMQKIDRTNMNEPIAHTKATKIFNDSSVEVSTIQQKDLTSDCWVMQFEGVKACASCIYYMKKQCGVGKTLAKMILEMGESVWSKMKVIKYFFNIDKDFNIVSAKENTSFYGLVEDAKEKHYLQYGLRKYKRAVEKFKQLAIEEQQKAEKNIQSQALDTRFPYNFIREKAKLVSREGWHYPRDCNCELVTQKGAYRDETYRIEDMVLHYYHQHCIVAEINDTLILDSCEYRTMTTKERINRYLPLGFRLYSKRFKWFIKTPKGTLEFFDGIVIQK